MTLLSGIRLRAFVGATEAAAVEEAARRLAAATRAPAAPVEFAASLDALGEEVGSAVVIASLLPEVEAALRDWDAAEARLTRAYEALARRCGERLFVCTVLRHAPPELDEDGRIALRIAIRRLDLLAIQLSHATGLNVIDLDRALADIGAQRLKTDYRLSGAAAAEAAGRAMAGDILAAGFEDWVAALAPAGHGGE